MALDPATNTPTLDPVLSALVAQGLISAEQAVEIAGQAGGSVIEEARLARKSGVDPEVVTQARATALGVPYVDLREQEVPAEVIALLPREVAEAHRAVAVSLEGTTLTVGFVEPDNYGDVQGVSFVVEKAGYAVRPAMVSEESFVAAVGHYEELGKEVAKALEAARGKFVKEEDAGEESLEGRNIEEVIKGAPVSRMINVIMRAAVEQGASDIHIEPLGKETRVRYRVDGVLRTSLMLPSYIHSALVSRVKVLSSLRLDETRIPQDGRITETIGGKVIDFRVSVIPVVDNEKVVMRILDTSIGVPTLEQLGFREEHVEVVRKEIKNAHGLILVSGPTGSGKSTTLYTILNMLNAEGSNIVTLEDPVEYYIKGVNQSQIRPEIGYTFASGLRSLLRQDPNVIMVGEIRDQETAELAVHASLTGHLIFSTIHTNDVFGIIPRLVDLHVEPFLISATMNVGISQRLARKICPDCKTEEEIPAAVLKDLREVVRGIPAKFLPKGVDPDGALKFYRGKGCASCKDFGYQGRVCVAEILMVTRELQKIITSGFKNEQVQLEAKRQGMLSLQQDGILKALAGLTTVEEVMRISQE